MEVLNQSTGLWRCRTAYTCPRDIPITEAIEQLKREMMWRRA
ncbi:hypothetical protein BH24DEI1_BH24DEI1_07400 [soil metagenome]|jgi:succinate dehydrogenase / fumarate reductase iron-sulfur subunit